MVRYREDRQDIPLGGNVREDCSAGGSFPQNLYFVGRNYAKHIEELENERPDRPMIFSKPVSCLASCDSSIPYPCHSQSLHFEGEMVFRLPGGWDRIDRMDMIEVGCGLDWTARDVQSEIKKKGWPWFEAKCFRGAAVVSDDMVTLSLDQLSQLEIQTLVNGEERQHGRYVHTLFKLKELVHYLEQFVDICNGDLLFNGTPEGVAAVSPGSILEVRLTLQGDLLTTCRCEVE